MYKKLNSTGTLIQKTTTEAPQGHMYYIGLDVHKKTISYCVKDASGQIHQEGKIGATRCGTGQLDEDAAPTLDGSDGGNDFHWLDLRSSAPTREQVKVAHPLMLRAIAAAKKKNDRIDAGKIADCLRCDFLPECHMASTEIRDRRRTLRYRHLLVRQMVQMKNRVSGLLMETGVSHNKQQLHKVGYFRELLATNPENIDESIRPLAAIEPGDHRTTAEDRIRPGPFSAARSDAGRANQTAQDGSGSRSDHRADLGTGDGRYFARFRSIRHAISYCGLCSEEKSSAEKVMRTPLSKQRNKHIQRALVEAAKLAPRQDHELALVYQQEKEKGNANRATLAVARKMVAYLLAVDRGQRDFVTVEDQSAVA